ncbi:MAG: LLM class flavin-dependent oxidoreductase [Geminicoccaceae bacterium]|nr:LLM class flavin-dependent oxidoreductase [Geminicoccaceae bacterium]
MIPFSVLDLAPIVEGGDATQSYRRSLDLARHVERWGYKRYWLAEHHNMPGIASAATSVLIAHIAGGTESIRVGAGGIMLPNHAPLQIAEQFGTLEALFPGRIDLGLGRAPGGDMAVAHALRRTLEGDIDRFPQDVMELQAYFEPLRPGQRVQAVPGAGLRVPLWILGSSLYGAQLAAALGLPYAFASHFAPAALMRAIEVYRQGFQPSAQLERPYLMLGFNVIAAETDEEAQHLATSRLQAFLNLRRGRPSKLPPPSATVDMAPHETAMVEGALSCSAVGSPPTVRRQLQSFIERTGADELIIASQIFDHGAQLRSYEIAAEARDAPT